MSVLPSQLEHPILYANGARLHVIGELLHKRSEWLRPIFGQVLDQGNTFRVSLGDGDTLRVCPGDNDLTVVSILATILKVVRCIEDCKMLAC